MTSNRGGDRIFDIVSTEEETEEETEEIRNMVSTEQETEAIRNSSETHQYLLAFFRKEYGIYKKPGFFIALRKKNHEKRLLIMHNGKQDYKSLALTALLKYHGSTVFTEQAQEEEIKIEYCTKEKSNAQHLNTKGTKISEPFFKSHIVASAMTIFLLMLLTKGSEISPEIKLLKSYVLTCAMAFSVFVVGVEGCRIASTVV